MAEPIRWEWRTRSWALWLGAAVAALTIASVIMHSVTTAKGRDSIGIFDVGDEVSLGGWFSSMLFLVAAGLCWLAADEPHTADRLVAGWKRQAVVMVALSIDEAVAIHERFDTALRAAFEPSGYLYYIWVVPALLLVAVVAAVQSSWLLALPRRVSTAMVVGGAVFVAGAAGLEVLSAPDAELRGTDNMFSVTLIAIEEFLEMAGLCLFVVAVVAYLERLGSEPTRAADLRITDSRY